VKKSEKAGGISVFTHRLVPKHEILSAKEAGDLLKRYHIHPYQLPFIRASDPAVQAIEGRPGDVVKITRKSPTAGECAVYRYVIEG